MDHTFEPLVRIPISRADFYPHGTLETPIEELDVTHLLVQSNVIEEGTITLAATKDAPGFVADHLEIDLDPTAARQLATEILAAVTQLIARQP
jgi:hypothetical protein